MCVVVGVMVVGVMVVGVMVVEMVVVIRVTVCVRVIVRVGIVRVRMTVAEARARMLMSVVVIVKVGMVVFGSMIVIAGRVGLQSERVTRTRRSFARHLPQCWMRLVVVCSLFVSVVARRRETHPCTRRIVMMVAVTMVMIMIMLMCVMRVTVRMSMILLAVSTAAHGLPMGSHLLLIDRHMRVGMVMSVIVIVRMSMPMTVTMVMVPARSVQPAKIDQQPDGRDQEQLLCLHLGRIQSDDQHSRVQTV
jgi:hypothetical protein